MTDRPCEKSEHIDTQNDQLSELFHEFDLERN